MSSTPTPERILKATRSLLERADAGDVRMADVAAAAGISRQALYLHYSSRAELLIATARHIDEANGIAARLAATRSIGSGAERLRAYLATWAAYIPEIYPVAHAFLQMAAKDADARAAWDDRMRAHRQGCAVAVMALAREGHLRDGMEGGEATDIVWTLSSLRNWESFTRDCGWSQRRYARWLEDSICRLVLADPQIARG